MQGIVGRVIETKECLLWARFEEWLSDSVPFSVTSCNIKQFAELCVKSKIIHN